MSSQVVSSQESSSVTSSLNDKEFQVLPILLKLEGIGEVYGVGAGISNIGQKNFDIHLGVSGGDAKAGIFSISNYAFAEGLLNYQFGMINELTLETQYSRSIQQGPTFQQELSGSGHHLGYEIFLDREGWAMQLDLLSTRVGFEEFKDIKGNTININMDGLTDVKSTRLSAAFNWDDREKQSFSEGVQVNNSMAFSLGRDGQADQGQWDFFVGQHVLMHDELLVSAYIKGSYAFVLGDIAEYDTDAEIRARLNAQCGADIECIALEEALVAFILSSNKYGTANAIGGSSGLRSYSEQLFRGANSWLEGVEIEYRLPAFTIFKGDKSLHLVAFAESAQVNDKLSDLFDDSLHTLGLGLRTYADDLAIRLETAHGENGNAWLLTVGLPY